MGKIRCKKCNDIIESKTRHDFKWCKCHSVYVDGGQDYLRCGGEREHIEFMEEDETTTKNK